MSDNAAKLYAIQERLEEIQMVMDMCGPNDAAILESFESEIDDLRAQLANASSVPKRGDILAVEGNVITVCFKG